MKRYLAILAALLCIAVLAVGCGGGNAADTDVPANDPAQDTPATDVDAILAKLIEDNDLTSILAQYKSVYMVSDVWNIEEGEEIWEHETVAHYDASSGRLVYDMYIGFEDRGGLYIRYEEPQEGVAPYCTYDEEKDEKDILMLDVQSGIEMICNNWIIDGELKGDEVISVEDDAELNTRVLTIRCFDEELGFQRDIVYFIDLETGLLTGLENRMFALQSGEPLSVARLNIVHGETREVSDMISRVILAAEDSCAVTFVENVGTEQELSYTYSIAKGTEVGWYGLQADELYADAACTQELYTIDTLQDAVTVYIADKY